MDSKLGGELISGGSRCRVLIVIRSYLQSQRGPARFWRGSPAGGRAGTVAKPPVTSTGRHRTVETDQLPWKEWPLRCPFSVNVNNFQGLRFLSIVTLEWDRPRGARGLLPWIARSPGFIACAKIRRDRMVSCTCSLFQVPETRNLHLADNTAILLEIPHLQRPFPFHLSFLLRRN